MKDSLHFVAKALGVLLLLYVFQKPIILVYESIRVSGMSLFPSSRLIPPGAYYDSSYGLIPAIALQLTTPGFPWKTRSLMLMLGISAYLALDLTSFLIWVTPPAPNVQVQEAHYIYTVIWKMLGQWGFPLLLWIIAVYRQINGMLFLRSSGSIASQRN